MALRELAVFAVFLFSSPSHGEVRDRLGEQIHQYREYTCLEITQAAKAVALRAETTGSLRPNNGKSETTVIFWPDVTRLEKELAEKMKDQMLVIEEAAIEKQCSIQFETEH